MIVRKGLVVPFVLLVSVGSADGQVRVAGLLDSIFGAIPGLSRSDSVDADTVAEGLKEALRVGTQRTVDSTSQLDGFLANELIRIAIPEQISTMATALRAVGLGARVDELEVTMNRAAELAAAEAKPIFWEAISQMTLSDAMGVLNGGETAATDYFRERTEANLESRFRPIVEAKMSQVGLYNLYEQLVSRYSALPLVSAPTLDLSEHVVNGSLDGLFAVLASEEARIRADPSARTTEILRRVFSG